MSAKHKYGLLLSQLLNCISKPLEEVQVWSLCFQICQSLSIHQGKTVENDITFNCWKLSVEMIYLRRDGTVMFISPNSSQSPKKEEDNESLRKQMEDLSIVLVNCLENGCPKEFLKRQVGSQLESMTQNLAVATFADSGQGWVDIVKDCCIQQLSSRTTIKPEVYYRDICESLVKEAMEMNNFLAVVMNEVKQCESKHDAFSTFQLSLVGFLFF